MQHCLVSRVGKLAEQIALSRVRLSQHRQRLIGMRGDDDMVEMLRTGMGFQRHSGGTASDAMHRGAASHGPAELAAQGIDIAAAAPAYCVPWRASAGLEQVVVAAKGDE